MIGIQQFLAAYLAGLISFLAPCVVPLFPSYFSVISGFTFAELYGLEFSSIRGRVFTSSLFFTFGFSIIYSLLGATGFVIGQLIEQYLSYLLRVSGFFLIILGLAQLGYFRFSSLRFDYAWNIQRRLKKMGYFTAFIAGIAAALSWIPCVGPLLSPILLLAAGSQTVFSGVLLLFIYSLGIMTPFLAGGLFFPKIVNRFRQQMPLLHRLSQLAGFILIFFGLILLVGQYQAYISFFNTSVERLQAIF